MASSPITSTDPEEWMLGYLQAAGLENAGPDFCATTSAWFAAAIGNAREYEAKAAKAEQGEAINPDPPVWDAPAFDHLDYMETDAQKWAQQFMAVMAKIGRGQVDEGLMIGWFANAIEAGRSAGLQHSIGVLAVQANDTAHAKGWWDPNNRRLFDGVLMLIVSEAAEALEEWRNNRKEDETYYSIPDYRPDSSIYEGDGDLRGAVEHLLRRRRGDALDREALADFSDEEIDRLIQTGFLKPEGIPSELADIVIRVFDAAVEYGIDIEEQIINKMAYNATRAMRHGGKRS
jgi:NTP pyrophosphatase (non-canonical NTP hydrolase)